ncbi:MAG: SxtJ family membrane protein, partial [Planctomycetota bacterium]
VAAAGPVVLVLGLIHPKLVWPVFVLLMLIAVPIGYVVSAILLRLIYYLLFTPIALWFRLTGKDAMQRRFEPEADSYWTDRKDRRDPASYLRLY